MLLLCLSGLFLQFLRQCESKQWFSFDLAFAWRTTMLESVQ